jgi:molecular chaperone DnaJ
MVKDYYQILEVERDADEKTIKSSYRRLANQWHPDKHSTESDEQKHQAEEKFKEISEAYSVLSDPERKANYDQSGNPMGSGNSFGFRTTGDPFDLFGFANFHRMHSRPQPMFGQTVQQLVEINLSEALFGAEKSIQYSSHGPCEQCNGQGGMEFESCSTCGGTGIMVRRETNLVMQTTCGACAGRGRRIKVPCSKCDAKGIVAEERSVKVQIPPAMQSGAILRISGAGGRGFNGGPAGDVLLHTQVRYPDMEKLTDEEKNQIKQLLSR